MKNWIYTKDSLINLDNIFKIGFDAKKKKVSLIEAVQNSKCDIKEIPLYTFKTQKEAKEFYEKLLDLSGFLKHPSRKEININPDYVIQTIDSEGKIMMFRTKFLTSDDKYHCEIWNFASAKVKEKYIEELKSEFKKK